MLRTSRSEIRPAEVSLKQASRMGMGQQNVPAPPFGGTGTESGMGVRHALFPVPTLGAMQAAGFPTLFSTASGVVGLVAGPSSALRSLDYRVRLFSPLGLVVAPPARGPGQDSAVTSSPRLDHLTPDRPPRLAVRWPDVTGLASYLSGRLSLTGQRCRLWHRRRVGEFSRALPQPRVSPGAHACFVRLSPVFGMWERTVPTVRPAPCWCAVATMNPQGHCDSHRPETSLCYLTRLGAASNRS